MPRLAMLEQMEQLHVVAQRAGNGAETSDVFRMTPPGVVVAAVGVRDIGDGAHRAPRKRRDAVSASRHAAATIIKARGSGSRDDSFVVTAVAAGGPNAETS